MSSNGGNQARNEPLRLRGCDELCPARLLLLSNAPVPVKDSFVSVAKCLTTVQSFTVRSAGTTASARKGKGPQKRIHIYIYASYRKRVHTAFSHDEGLMRMTVARTDYVPRHLPVETQRLARDIRLPKHTGRQAPIPSIGRNVVTFEFFDVH